MIRLVLFDLDDTLFNATELIKFARTDALNSMIKLGLNIDLREGLILLGEVVQAYGSNHPHHFDILLRRLNHLNPKYLDEIPPEKLSAAAVIAYHKVKVKHIKPYKDVIPTFLKIKKAFSPEIKIGILTDGVPIKQYEKILRLNLDKHLDIITISDEIGIRKPNPKLWEFAIQKMNVDARSTLYIGDRLDRDVIPAKSVGIHTVLIHRGGKYDPHGKNGHTNEPQSDEPDYHIDKLGEVIDIIKEINQEG